MEGHETQADASRGVGRLIPVAQWEQHHPWPRLGALRWMIHAARRDGDPEGLLSSGAIIKVGGRMLVDETRFLDWAREGNELACKVEGGADAR